MDALKRFLTGGTIGVFCGLSILSIFELAFWVARMLVEQIILLYQRKKRNSREQEQNEKQIIKWNKINKMTKVLHFWYFLFDFSLTFNASKVFSTDFNRNVSLALVRQSLRPQNPGLIDPIILVDLVGPKRTAHNKEGVTKGNRGSHKDVRGEGLGLVPGVAIKV